MFRTLLFRTIKFFFARPSIQYPVAQVKPEFSVVMRKIPVILIAFRAGCESTFLCLENQ